MANFLFFILLIGQLFLFLNIMYGFFFIFSFKGVKNFYEKTIEEDFTIFLTLFYFVFFGPAYYFAKYVYSKINGFFARLSVFAFLVFLTFLMYLDLRILITGSIL